MWNWIRALFLDERIALLRELNNGAFEENCGGYNHYADDTLWDQLAVARYIREGVLTEEEAYAPLGLDRDLLRAISQLSSSGLHEQVEPPEWVEELSLWKDLGAGKETPLAPKVAFSNLAGPVWGLFEWELSGFWSDFHGNFLNQIPIKPTSMEPLVKSLASSLPTGELNSAVMPSVVEFVQTRGYLKENSSEGARVFDFSEADRNLFVETYPVVYRQLYVALDKWRNYVSEILEALSRDLGDLDRETFFDLKGGLSEIEIQLSKGDTHEYGKSVAQVTVNGNKVFFKPYPPYGKRCLEVASEILGEVLDNVKRVPYLDRGTYFWEKAIQQNLSQDCLGSTAKALGSFSALTSVLGGNDFHHENVFFSDGGIVPVDLETILHPSVAKTDEYEDPNLEIRDYFQSSIATKGILPFTMVSQGDRLKDQHGVDISVLGLPPEQAAAVTIPYVSSGANGDLQLKFERPLMTDDSGVTGRHELLQYGEDFLDGYAATFENILEKRQDLLDAFEALPDLAMRYVARPTMLYNKVLLESFHPQFTKDSMDRLACLYKLGTGFIGENDRSEKIKAEIRFLEIGDIPRFNSNLHDGVVWSQFCGVSGRTRPLLGDLQRRLRTMDLRELKFVRSLVNHSFRLPEPARSFPFHRMNLGLTVNKRSGSPDYELLSKALTANMVDSFGRSPSGHVVALEMTAVTESIWTLTPAGCGFYNGLSGIALALISAYYATDDAQCLELADRILIDCGTSTDLLVRDLENGAVTTETLDFGFYGVSGGLLFCCLMADRYGIGGDSKAWKKRYVKLLTLITESALSEERDIEIDVVSGLAGTVLMVLTTMQICPEVVAPALAKLTNRLIKLVKRVFLGDGGSRLAPNDERLLGFAHGSDGILYTLSRVVKYLPGHVREDVLEVTELLFSWEFEIVRRAGYKWPDFRESSEATDFTMSTWCHGAPGAMIAMRQLEGNKLIARDTAARASELAAIAEGQTLSSLRGDRDQFAKHGHSLCHSKLSNAFIGKKYASIRNQGEFGEMFDKQLDEMSELGWIGGGIEGVRSQGLMTGMAGTLLMVADSASSEAFPDVLCP